MVSCIDKYDCMTDHRRAAVGIQNLSIGARLNVFKGYIEVY